MNISRSDLYRIVLEEYLLEEGHAGTDAAEELLKRILGDKYKPPEERDPTRYAKHAGDTEPMETPHAVEEPEDLTGVMDVGETYPNDPDETPARAIPQMSSDELVDSIGELIHGRDPEEVAEIFETVYLVQEEPASSILQLVRNKEADDIQEIFQLAFEKLPGVELSSPGDEDYPGEETLYSPGAEGRPVAGFQLENLMELIREVLDEGHYHDMGDEPQQDQADQESGYKSQLKQIIKEETAYAKIPVEKMDEFKRRLEDWAMYYRDASSWVRNDAVLPPTREQVEEKNPYQEFTRISQENGRRLQQKFTELDDSLRALLNDFDMKFKKYERERSKALSQLALSEVSSETHRCSIDTGEGYWDRSIKSAAECKRAGGKWVDLKKFLGKFGEAREKDT